jgi:hypothetical protein
MKQSSNIGEESIENGASKCAHPEPQITQNLSSTSTIHIHLNSPTFIQLIDFHKSPSSDIFPCIIRMFVIILFLW